VFTKGVVACLWLVLCCPSFAFGQALDWVRQLGTSSWDASFGVSADALGNVYIAGWTEGGLEGANAGGTDGFVSRFDTSGSLEWTRQFGTSGNDWVRGVAADGLGNVYLAGETEGSLAGTNAGGSDAFISKYDATGVLLWTRQFGTSETDQGFGVSADGLGSVYISGWTRGGLDGANAGGVDAFISKYDASGTLEWTRQLGTSVNDWSRSISADGLGGVYMSGGTYGSLEGANAGGEDAYVSKFDASGTLEWIRQFGTDANDWSYFISADRLRNVYASGGSFGNLDGINAGRADAYVSKFDANGTLEWTRQLGTSGPDFSRGVSADGRGSVYITGGTEGSLEAANAGGEDAFVSKYDASGRLEWTRQLGTGSSDWGRGVSADGLGNVYVTGGTEGSLGARVADSVDGFLARYTGVGQASGDPEATAGSEALTRIVFEASGADGRPVLGLTPSELRVIVDSQMADASSLELVPPPAAPTLWMLVDEWGEPVPTEGGSAMGRPKVSSRHRLRVGVVFVESVTASRPPGG